MDPFTIYEEFRQTFDEKSAKILAKALSKIYFELSNLATKDEFKELKNIVADLAEAQKRTELSIKELTEAQKRTEARVEELAEAQKKTEKVVKGLLKDMADVKRRVEGLSDTVGYGLEDKLIPFIPSFIKNRYGYNVSFVDRKNIIYPNGKFDEINIYIEADKNGDKVLFIGECKAKPGKKDIKQFLKLKERVAKFTQKNVISFIVGYSFHPEVETYLLKIKELDFFKTFEIERISQKGV